MHLASSPALSIVVVAYNMQRELPRTLYTLSSLYQKGLRDCQYEVVVVDNGSVVPLVFDELNIHGTQFRLVRRDGCSSPAAAMNHGVAISSGRAIMACIDGARLLSPGIIRNSMRMLDSYSNPVVATLAWHLGAEPQFISVNKGYNQDAEDELLASVDWRRNGYDLFSVSSLAGSSGQGWLKPISESNCVSMHRSTYESLGGFDEAFRMPGGGLVNLDFYKRACELTGELILLLGEGTFHQFHGGVASNAADVQAVFETFHDEYKMIRGHAYSSPLLAPILHGMVPLQCLPFLRHSILQVST